MPLGGDSEGSRGTFSDCVRLLETAQEILCILGLLPYINYSQTALQEPLGSCMFEASVSYEIEDQ